MLYVEHVSNEKKPGLLQRSNSAD